MDTQELLLVATGFAAAVLVAHTIGARRGRQQPQEPAKDTPKEAKQELEQAPAAAEASTEESPEPAAPGASLPSLACEDDDDIDPTRVGQGAGPSATKKHARMEPPVMPIVYDLDAEADTPTQQNSLFLVSATAQTDVGLRRRRNEDSVLMAPDENLFVVADGMGGYEGGELASKLAVKSIRESLCSPSGSPRKDLPRDATALARAIQVANDAILEEAGRKKLTGMGTTVCAARFSPNKKRVYIGHVGDSRCYRLRAGVLEQLTKDHTMSDFGVTGPESGHLSRAVGIWPSVPIDIVMAEPHHGDVYLLCSDGLTKMLPDDTIRTVLASEEDPQAAVDRLVFFANAHGGKDNITVVLVRVVSPDPKLAHPDAADRAKSSEQHPS